MLDCVHHLDKSTVTASDGVIGHVKDVFFDDIRWTIRYLVVDTGHWMSGREVPRQCAEAAMTAHVARFLLDSGIWPPVA